MTRRILVLATGGTIATAADDNGVGHVSRRADALLAHRPLPGGIEVEFIDVLAAGSNLFTAADQVAVARAVVAAAPTVDGIVVTHGTDTLEETAFLIDLVHAGATPVVVTGAQRTADDPDADGPRNLVDAITLAADPDAVGSGTVVLFAGTVLPARGAFKTDTVKIEAFANRDGATLGRADARTVRLRTQTRSRTSLDPSVLDRFGEQRVEVVAFAPGLDTTLLRACAATRARGVVVIGVGVGNTAPSWIEGIADLVAGGMTVVLATRVPFGPVVPLPGHGGGADALAAGAVSAGTLSPWQARVALQAALAADPSGRRVAQIVAAVAGVTERL